MEVDISASEPTDTSTALGSEGTKLTWREHRAIQEDEFEPPDEDEDEDERPGAFPVGGINMEAWDDMSTLGGAPSGLPVASITAELVEEKRSGTENVKAIVAELLRQQQLAKAGIKVSSLPHDKFAEAVVIDQKRICGIPRIWVMLGLIVSALAIGLAVSLGVKKPPPTSISKEPQLPEAPPSTTEVMGDSFLEALEGREFRDLFGHYVEFSRDGSTLAISAPGGNRPSPYVRVFRQTSTTGGWSVFGQTIEGDGNFGHRVDLNEDGTMMVIGAPTNDDVGADNGRVRVYQNNLSDTWVQVGQDLNGLEAGDLLGWDVAISDDGKTIACTARSGNPGGLEKAGYVLVFILEGEEWTQLGPILVGEEAGDEFGRSVALSSSGRRVAIGAVLGGGGKGRIYVYDYSDSADDWDRKGQYLDGINDQDWQGTSVDLSSDGNILAIGSDGHDTSGSNAGMVRVYELVDSVWVQYGNSIYGEAESDQLGAGQVSLSSAGNMLAVGGNNNENDKGKAYLYRFIDGAWEMVHQAEGNAAGDHFGFSVNVSGDGSFFAAGGPRTGTSERTLAYVHIFSVKL
jgi:hypothetical protein